MHTAAAATQTLLGALGRAKGDDALQFTLVSAYGHTVMGGVQHIHTLSLVQVSLLCDLRQSLPAWQIYGALMQSRAVGVIVIDV